MDRHTDIAYNIFCKLFVSQNFGESVPAMLHGVKLEKVILAPITAYFKLGTQSVGSSETLGLSDRFNDVCFVVLKTHGPLVQLRCGQHRVFFVHNLTDYFKL